MIFLKLTNKDTTERLAARAVVVIGVITLILGSYVNLEEASRTSPVEYNNRDFVQPAVGINDVNNQQSKPDSKETDLGEKIDKAALNVIKNMSSDGIDKKAAAENSDEKRLEPANPEEPLVADVKKEDTDVKIKKGPVGDTGSDKVMADKVRDEDLKPDALVERVDRAKENEKAEIVIKNKEEKKEEVNAEKLLQELQRQKEESDKILEKQKEILKELEEHKKQDSAQNFVKVENNPNMFDESIKDKMDMPRANSQVVNSNQQNEVKANQNPPRPQPVKQIIPIDEVKQESFQSLQGNVQNIPEIQQKQVGNDNPQQRHNQPNPPPPQQQPIIQDAQHPAQFQQRINGEGPPQIQLTNVQLNHKAEKMVQQLNNQPLETKKSQNKQQDQINKHNNPVNIPSVETRKLQKNNLQQNSGPNNKAPMKNPDPSQIQLQQVNKKNIPNHDNPILSASNGMEKRLENYNIKADIKQGLLAYDQEQRDLIHPFKTEQNSAGKVPGRDLKEERLKRSATDDDSKLNLNINCENDPLCNLKFSRDPVGDSLVDRDLTKFLQVGKRALLEIQSDVNNNTDQGI